MAKYDFVEAIPSEHGWLYVVECDDAGNQEVIDHVQDTKEDAEREGRAHKAFMLGEERMDRNEHAMQQGMLHGINAYNESMNYD